MKKRWIKVFRSVLSLPKGVLQSCFDLKVCKDDDEKWKHDLYEDMEKVGMQ
jgi:hypothetical protein